MMNKMTKCSFILLGSVAILNTVAVSAQENDNLVENSEVVLTASLNNEESIGMDNIVEEETTEIIDSVIIDENQETISKVANEEVMTNKEIIEPIEVTEMNNMETTEDETAQVIRAENTKDTLNVVTEYNEVTQQHVWNSAIFGESTNEKKNSVVINDNQSVTLHSANFDPDTKIIKDKGGKFTAYHDGISYYYTEIDAQNENFELTATFHVDYLNPKADGQEGFGIIARDRIGFEAEGDQQFPTNSASALAIKVKVDNGEGGRKDLKPGLASRFVTGLTPEVIAEGASAMSANGVNVITPFKNDTSIAVKEGQDYTLKLKKTNTGYHAIYEMNGEIYENILYGVDKLQQLNQEKLYVGVAAARGVNTTVSNITLTVTNPLTDAPAIPEPIQLIEPTFKLTNHTRTGNESYQLEMISNVEGTAKIIDQDENIIEEIALSSNSPAFIPVNLKEGDNKYDAVFIASEPEKLTSKEAIKQTTLINHRKYTGYFKENIGTYLNVSPVGSAEGDGTPEKPLDIFTAIDYVQPGQMIELIGGIYEMDRDVMIHRGNNGTVERNKLLGTVDETPAIFDFTKGGSFVLNGDYWKIDNIHVRNTKGNVKGLTVGGNYNHLQRIEAYQNGDTGIQISGNASEPFEMWPSYNVIENSTSYNNVDPGHNNADGFAAKITVGEGNVFRGDIAYNNVDDGWDLFAKLESGLIGTVTIENSVAYRNGTNLDGTAFGDGNGFKLGGDGIAINHVLRNSLSFDNDASGVTSNSNPAANVYNTISVKNKGSNLSLYGKGDAEVTSVAKGVVTWQAGESDVPGNLSVTNEATNYINGVNSLGEQVDQSWFKHTDMSKIPIRKEDGSIDLNGLFVLLNSEIGVQSVVSEPLLPYDRKQADADVEEIVVPDEEKEEDIIIPNEEEIDDDIAMPDEEEIDDDIAMPNEEEIDDDIAMPNEDEVDNTESTEHSESEDTKSDELVTESADNAGNQETVIIENKSQFSNPSVTKEKAIAELPITGEKREKLSIYSVTLGLIGAALLWIRKRK